jgi:LuxR family maltose regulon positive regulatory protein
MTTGELAPPAGMPFGPPGVLVTKLHPPVVQAQTVVRRRLLDALAPQPAIRLTVVAAPAGYGKSTLLAMWREVEAARRSVAWVTLDDRDNDPVVLWSHVIEALTRVCPGIAESTASALHAGAALEEAVLPRLVNDLAGEDDVALILDDFHRLSHPGTRRGVRWLIDHAPGGLQLLVASRTEPALGLGVRRARGELLELRARELGFTADEAESLLNDHLELGLDRTDVEDLVGRTEGWPAGLYLAALSLRGAPDRHAFIGRFGGTARPVVDFLVDEVLDTYDPELQTLMVRCSVLERLSGPLCDAVLDDAGTGEALRSLSRTNLFLLALDDEEEWYRFHHVFAQLLRVELEHREPGLPATLHRRAYAWYREHGLVDEAIEHAIAAGAFDAAQELICATWTSYANVGRYSTVLGWLERCPRPPEQQDARLLAVEAWVLSLCGRPEALAAIAAAEAAAAEFDGPLPDGFNSVAGSLATLRGALPWGDVGGGWANAQRAFQLEDPRTPLWAAVCWGLAIGSYFTGRPEEADRWFAATIDVGRETEQWLVTAGAFGYRSLIAGAHGRLEDQRRLAEEGVQLARERGIETIDGEVHLAAAISHLARGDAAAARSHVERGVEALRSFGQPTDLAFALIQQVKVLRELGDHDRAAAAIGEAREVVDGCRDPGVLEEWVAALEASPQRRPSPPAPELSPRERSLLRFLTGPLSERDIGRELYLSHNTVHSHTRSIYRKLGVSSRAEAVERARSLGFL